MIIGIRNRSVIKKVKTSAQDKCFSLLFQRAQKYKEATHWLNQRGKQRRDRVLKLYLGCFKHLISVSLPELFHFRPQDFADVCRREDPAGEERDVDRISGLGSSRLLSLSIVLLSSLLLGVLLKQVE